MEAHEVSALHDAMRRYGLPGVLTPVDPLNLAGRWHVLDDARGGRDITDATIEAAAVAALRRPTRGFVTVG
ncbi:hypothetical protein [Streptomyces sp. LMG1-1-1.1]|uniref:hypothetical protein n=1 Tax=Streptomyces sp. LMG1-1-1.1 TaxID=3135245 RepID=UPI003467ECDB